MSRHQSTSFPGKPGVIAINAAPRVIQSALVKTDDHAKHAVITLGYYAGTTKNEKADARQAALVAVMRYLGDGWGAEVRER